jgi:hypothetical protein
MKAEIGKGLQKALVDYGKIVDFICNTNSPVMLVSAEKALQNKNDFVESLINFNANIKGLGANKELATNFITKNPKDYLDSTRITKSKGIVDLVTKTNISGWAFYYIAKIAQ